MPIVVGLEASVDSSPLDASALRRFFTDEFQTRRRRFPHSAFVLLIRASEDIAALTRAAAAAADIRVVSYDPDRMRPAHLSQSPAELGALADLCHVLFTVAPADRVPSAAMDDDLQAITLAPEFRVELIRVRLHPDTGNGTYSVAPDGPEAEPSAHAMQRTEEFNRYASAEAADSTTAPALERGLAGLFDTADRLARACQTKLRRAFLAIFWVALVTTMFYGVFSEVSKDQVNIVRYALAFYVLSLLIAYAIYYLARRSDIHNRFIEYRALAEGARVQRHWNRCGIDRSAADVYLDRHPVELHWIRLALRSTGLLPETSAQPPATTVEAELAGWIADQQRYFASSLERSRGREKLARYFVIAIFALGGCATAVSLFFPKYAPLLPYQSEIGFVSILCSAVATAVVALVNKLGILYQVRHYSRMLEIYSRAESYLAAGAPPSARAVATALGEEALRESGAWLLFRRDRGLDQPASPFRRPSW